MNAEEALKFVEELLSEREQRLNDLQRSVFLGVWQGKSYKEILKEVPHRTELGNLQGTVAHKLWKQLTEILGEKVLKNNLHGPVKRAYESRSRNQLNGSSNPLLSAPAQESNGQSPTTEFPEPSPDLIWSSALSDWGDAPNTSVFFGRSGDLANLEQRIRIDGCRLLTIYGMTGIGKTLLATKLAEEIRDHFEFLIWRSLTSCPLPAQFIGMLTQFFSHQQSAATDLTSLLHYLQHHRCVIVLDGLEAVLQPGVHDGSYRPGYEDYGELLRQVGRMSHQSCLVVTSQEKPREIDDSRQVHSLELRELGDLEGQEILTAKGVVAKSDSGWRELIQRYTGNPFALNVVASQVHEMFGGDLDAFLNCLPQDRVVFEDIRARLTAQFDRLSELEKRVLHCLQAAGEPIPYSAILQALESLGHPISWMQLQDVLGSLRRRSLIKPNNAIGVSLQSLMSEYVYSLQQS
ncbi:MAG: NACHT domain-containing protein [Leptolyngbyaceae cyanobacterium SL_7_1]|nr:NACHT domain-containing protein [Leptolyngbyaceae cyanobacterium SL_7_1]